MKVYLELITDFGTYSCEHLDVDEEGYNKLKEYVRNYFTEIFEAYLQDGSFIVVPPAMLAHSHLFIRLTE